MQDNSHSVRRTFWSKRSFVIALTLSVGLLLVGALIFGPAADTTKVAAAQQDARSGVSDEALAIALGLRAAGDYNAFGEKGLTASGGSVDIRGNAGSAGKVTGDSLRADTGNPEAAAKALGDVMSFVNQLPCTVVDSNDLSGRVFGPGVYCLSSASLAGEMTLDAGGNANAAFVFRVARSFSTGEDSTISLAGGARTGNVYIVAGETITIGADSEINANLISGGDINVNRDSTVGGRALAKGELSVNDAQLGGGSGYVEICKDLDQTFPAPTQNYTFTIGSQTITVPAGQCSAPIQVPVPAGGGSVTITEGTVANTQVSDIRTFLANGTPAPDRLLAGTNRATRTAVVFVPEVGGVENETLVRFTNRATRTGTIEICKNPLDTDVTGPWTYTLPGTGVEPNPTVTVFTGSCSLPITVTIPSNVATGSPFVIRVTELGRETYRFESAFTRPANRFVGQGFNPDNGGFADIQVIAGSTATNQTTVVFNNRSLPGRIKVCKITADTSTIPTGTVFRFNVRGITSVGGEPVAEVVTVQAGPASQGGFCQFTANNYVVGSTVRVDETDNITGLPSGITADMVRTSDISSLPAGTLVNAVIGNPRVETGVISRADVVQRNALTTVTFTNYVFRPAVIKLCKALGANTTAADATRMFTFNIALADPLVSRPLTQTSVNIQAGHCVFLNGPFAPVPAFDPTIGTFNFNTRLIITEVVPTGFNAPVVTSPTGCSVTGTTNGGNVLICNRIDGPSPAGINEYIFTNSRPAAGPNPGSLAVRLDFDGDRRADVAIFRPSTGTWWYAASTANGQPRAGQFGADGDKPIPADFDGDGRMDYAVYRGGQWHIQQSSDGTYKGYTFGLATDVPQPGDFDGDGKADLAVYRPSDGSWHVFRSTNSSYYAFPFGISTDLPIAADYDGDGRMDPAVYRDGTWHLLRSTAGYTALSWGNSTDRAIPADYDGDGKADAAVYRGGQWYILRSTGGVDSFVLGGGSDAPTPADYDGDGKVDPAVYRSSTSTWTVRYSGAGSSQSPATITFGAAGDMIMPF
ncbi:MAG: ice-binding family protein [Pyrinomonadaceae bacterium]